MARHNLERYRERDCFVNILKETQERKKERKKDRQKAKWSW